MGGEAVNKVATRRKTRRRPDSFRRYRDSVTYEKFVDYTFKRLSHEARGKVTRNQKLLGRQSGHKHQIDVVVQVRVFGLDVLVLVECKHFRGVIVTTIGFQGGARKVAEGHGIALVRTDPEWQWVRHMEEKGVVLAATHGSRYVGPRESPTDQFRGVAPRLAGTRLLAGRASPGWEPILAGLVAAAPRRGGRRPAREARSHRKRRRHS
jgi:hypothetical protein